MNLTPQLHQEKPGISASERRIKSEEQKILAVVSKVRSCEQQLDGSGTDYQRFLQSDPTRLAAGIAMYEATIYKEGPKSNSIRKKVAHCEDLSERLDSRDDFNQEDAAQLLEILLPYVPDECSRYNQHLNDSIEAHRRAHNRMIEQNQVN